MYQNFIIWGAGYYGTRIERLISKEPEHKILAFCDSNTELVGKRIDQYDVVSIEKAVEMCRQDSRLVIVIGIFNYDVIKEVKQAALKYFPQHTKVITGHDIKDAIENKPGFVRAMWCGNEECENKIKEDTTATSRCMPMKEEEPISDVCVCCGKPAHKLVYWGKAY